MNYAKLISALVFENSNGEKFKYEIFQDFPGGEYYAVIQTKQDLKTENFGMCPVWAEINGYLRLEPLNSLACEEECKAHFINSY